MYFTIKIHWKSIHYDRNTLKNQEPDFHWLVIDTSITNTRWLLFIMTCKITQLCSDVFRFSLKIKYDLWNSCGWKLFVTLFFVGNKTSIDFLLLWIGHIGYPTDLG